MKIDITLHIGHAILISHHVLNYFRYKMAAKVCPHLRAYGGSHPGWKKLPPKCIKLEFLKY
jgi:hypothetical protein